MEIYEKKHDNTLFLRKLRKEKHDLIDYVNRQCDDDKNEYIQLIESEYILLGGC